MDFYPLRTVELFCFEESSAVIDISNFLITAGIVVASIGSLYFVGLPVSILLSNPDENKESIFLISPFLGLATIVLVLQNLVYSNIRLEYGVPFVWLAVLALWVCILRKNKIIGFLEKIPWPALLAALFVYSVHALGLFILGAKYYVGRAWHDQLNSTLLAQLLIDYNPTTRLIDFLFAIPSNACHTTQHTLKGGGRP